MGRVGRLSRRTRSWSWACGGARAASARSTTSPPARRASVASRACSARYLSLVEFLLLARIPVSTRSGSSGCAAGTGATGSPAWRCCRPHGAHHGRLRARRRRLADARDGRPAHALLGRAAGHRRARAAGRSSSSARWWPSAAGSATRVGTRCTSRPTSRSRWPSAISSPPAASSQGQPVARVYWWALYAVALGRSSGCGWCSRSRARCATGCGSSA